MLNAILADDLTGAADTGVEFARAGWRTRVLRRGWQPADLRGAEVAVIDTASRADSAAAAYAAVRRAAERLQEAGCTILYKKVDSTLRGQIGAELDAVLDTVLDAVPHACGLPLAILCPAFPAQGRTLIGGVLRVDGVPAAQSAAGGDPRTPVHESHLPTLLASQTRRRIYAIERPPAGYACAALAAQWQALLPEGGIAVVDAGDEDDLAQIAQAAQLMAYSAAGEQKGVQEGQRGLVLAGSAGLARFVAANMAGERRPHVLIVCGSLHPKARAQLRALQEQPEGIAVHILATPEARTAGAAQQPVQGLAQEAAGWLTSHAVCGVIVTGGDTLDALLAALDAGGIDLEQALAPGIALGRIGGGPWAGLRIASKAGGFGDVNALVQAVRHLTP